MVFVWMSGSTTLITLSKASFESFSMDANSTTTALRSALSSRISHMTQSKWQRYRWIVASLVVLVKDYGDSVRGLN